MPPLQARSLRGRTPRRPPPGHRLRLQVPHSPLQRRERLRRLQALPMDTLPPPLPNTLLPQAPGAPIQRRGRKGRPLALQALPPRRAAQDHILRRQHRLSPL